jgi:hypothetical protein
MSSPTSSGSDSFSLLNPTLSDESNVPEGFTALQRIFRAKRELQARRSLRSSSSSSANTTTIIMSNQVEINGVKVKIAATKKVVTPSDDALYPKSSRANMDPEKLNELFDRAAAKMPTKKYDILDLKIDDPDKLTDTYDLEMCINRTRAHHHKYDMHDVFTIVKPDTDPTKFKFVNLYADYAQVTEAEVAASNEWYATMTEDPDNTWFVQNLKVTHEHLANNAEDRLVTKINETYYMYPFEQRGGPLFFKIMLDLLQNNSDDTATYLINVIKNLKITDFDGEDINKVVSLIRGAVSRLGNLKMKSGLRALPEDFAEILLKVFKTSSVPEFNKLFEHFTIQTQLASFNPSSAVAQRPTVEHVLRFAESQYRRLCSMSAWTGVATKANETSFKACLADHKGETICFNCGGSHSLKECSKPQSEARIKANKKTFWEEKKKKDGAKDAKSNPKSADKKSKKDSKWAPPTRAEKKAKSRRTIDGKEYYYHYKDKRWKLVDQPTPVGAQAPSAPSGNVAEAPTSAPAPPTTAKEVAVLNATRQMENVFRGLLSQF